MVIVGVVQREPLANPLEPEHEVQLANEPGAAGGRLTGAAVADDDGEQPRSGASSGRGSAGTS